jgi:hypothetical protein
VPKIQLISFAYIIMGFNKLFVFIAKIVLIA